MSKKAVKTGGVIIPMVTPFTRKGKIDQAATKSLIDHIVGNGCNPFILGTTGESLSIPAESKLAFMRIASRFNAGRKTFYAGISGLCMEESVKTGKMFADEGADILVAHLPAYYPLPEENMLRYFTELADALPVPLMLYNIRSTTHMSIPVRLVRILSEHDNIIGLKDSERDEVRMNTLLDFCREKDDFSYQLGWAAKSTDALKGGADGIVPSTGNAFPQYYYSLYTAVQQGDYVKAEKYQALTDKLSMVYQKDKLLSQALPGLKLMLNHLGLCESHCLPPCYPPDAEVAARIVQEMETIIGKVQI